MAATDPIYAQWLMAEALWQVSTDAALSARWGATAQTTQRVTTIATKADAEAEAARQIAFLGGNGPLVIEDHEVVGSWAAYLGQVITLTIDRLGYDAGLQVFLIGVQDKLSSGLSTLTVIRRL
jgi:hypothetical protein